MPLKSHRPLLLILSLSIVLLLSACGSGGDAAPAASTTPAAPASPLPTTDSAAEAASPAPTLEPSATPEPLAALVNGEGITLADFETEVERATARDRAIGRVPADLTAYRRSVLDRMIDQVLIEQAAAVQGLSVSDEELDAEIALQVDLAGGRDAWLQWIQADLYTEDTYRADIHSALLTNKLVEQVTASLPDTADQVHARHILVATQEEAQALYEQLQNGADFGELAAAHSRDSGTASLGGDLGWFAHDLGQLLVQEVADAAFALQPGEISQPILSRRGYHLVQTLERVSDRPLDELARADLFEVTFERWRQSLWDQADIQVLISQ